MDIVCLQLYLYNSKYNSGKGRPHVPLDHDVPTIARMFHKEGKFSVQVRGFAKFDPAYKGGKPPRASKQQERLWYELSGLDADELTRMANEILNTGEMSE